MADDELRSESQKDLADIVFDFGTTAAALGAGAVSLYRLGAARQYSNMFSKVREFSKEATNELLSYSYNDLSAKTFSNIKNNLKDSWKRIDHEIDSTPIRLRANGRNSLIGFLADYRGMMERAPAIVRDTYNNEIYASVMKEAGSINEKYARSYSDFVRNIIEAGEASEKVINRYKQEFNPENSVSLNKLAEDSIALIEKKKAEKPYSGYEDKMLPLIRKGIKEKGLNSDLLAEKFGASFLKKDKIDRLTGDSPITLGELFELKDKVKSQMHHVIDANGEDFHFDLLKNAEELAEEIRKEQGEEAYNKFLSLHVDKWIRKDSSGRVYSLQSARSFVDDIFSIGAKTMPGKILKLRDFEQAMKEPSFYLSGAGSNDAILASMLGNDKNSVVSGNFLRILNKTYQITENGFEHIEQLDDTRLVSSRFGSLSRQMQKMSGEESYKNVEQGTFKAWFDIGTTPGRTIFDSLREQKSRKSFKQNADELFKLSPDEIHAINAGDEDTIRRGFEFISDYTRFLNKNVFALDQEALRKLDTVTGEGKAKSILSVLQKSDEEMIDSLLTTYGSVLRTTQNDSIMNVDLSTLLRRYMKDSNETLRGIALKGDRSNAYYQGNIAQTFYDLVRTELSKEYFLQYAKENKGDSITSVKNLIESANIQGDRKNPKRLAYLAILENDLGLYQAKNITYSDSDKKNILTRGLNIFARPDDRKSVEDFRNTFRDIVNEKWQNVDVKADREDVIRGPKQASYVHIHKTFGPKYIIEQLNLATKGKASLKDIAKPITQFFTAGRGNMKDVTVATMIPYTALSRLTEEMEYLGLGFSSKYTDNFLKYSAAFFTKRILPPILAWNYYEWFDDTVQAVTGTGTSAMFVNGLANVDLGLRRIGDTFGITGALSDFKDVIPQAQYIFGKDDVQSYDERLDYYRNGYDPVRSGRFWIFASSNEFRGGKIQYFEPNLVRRLNSDYADKAIYNGYFDKWSHSLLPTPTNPFSPLIAIADPYWLEERFKDERPYPLSGKLFAENTPWGIILNPTIGEMIKPQKRMHQDRLYGGIDAKALLYQMNMEQFRKSVNEDRANTVILAEGKTSAITYAPFMTEINIRTGWNPITGYDLSQLENHDLNMEATTEDGVPTIDITTLGEAAGPHASSFYIGDQGTARDRIFNDARDTIFTKAGKGNIFALAAGTLFGGDAVRSLDIIRETNIRIKQRAAVQDTYQNGKGTIADTIYNSSKSISDLLDAPTGTDIISEAAISARLITGIYGYAAERFLGIGDENAPHIADAGNITSFSRWFWDQGFGGLGGGTSEIGRRFIPAFRRRAEINPLMNEMPDWLPERFRIGDPYSNIPKGELRLPGRGYEAINVLHPDAFGAYGIFDRYKILADVAPGSPEFKTYRKLAKQFVKSPELIKEMEQIEERVSQQQQRHDFYNYRFLGKNAEYRQEVVSKILKDGTFQVVGSKDTYRLAGVKVSGRNDLGITSEQAFGQFLHEGQTITLAMDEDIEARRNTDNTISAAVFAGGENITESIIDQGFGTKIKDGQNYADMLALHGSFTRGLGSVMEAIGHLDLPLISSRWMRIRSPYETYLAEEVYGTPYQTWAEIAASFLFPAYERAISDTNYTITGLGAMAVQSYFDGKSLTKWQSRAVNAGVSLFNRGAFIGGAISHIIDTDNGKLFRAGQKIGSAAMLLGNMWVSPQNDSLVDSMLTYGYAGYQIADILRDKAGETTTGVIDAFIEGFKKGKMPRKISATYKAAAFGAAIGAALYGQNVNILDDNPKKWIPDRIKEKRDMDEYFDRLNYIKFMGLYHKAAEKALEEEGVPVEQIFSQYEKNQEKIKELQEDLHELEESLLRTVFTRDAEILIRNQLEELQNERITLQGGEYTRSAALYKQAAENTMYHMSRSNNTKWYDIIKALPKNERDYFHAFKDVTDSDERDKILEVASPLLEIALRKVWNMDPKEMESNESYFQDRNLPNFLWSGWNPKIDLADVKVKTIKNEGMLFSDFGIYESQLREEDVINAPNLSPYESQDPLTLKANLEATMAGLGLTGVEVSVEPKADSGIDAFVNLAITTHYQAKQVIDGVFKYM